MRERVYTRVAMQETAFKIECPACDHVLWPTGDAQNWGMVRRHLNVHVKKGEMLETAKVTFLKERGI